MKKISKSLYFGIIYGGMGGGFIQIIFGLIFLDSYENSDIAFGYFFIFLAAASFIASGIMTIILLYKLWDGLQVANPRSTPGKAVGLLFIPFFNWYWAFQCYWGFAVDFNNYISKKEYSIKKISQGVPMALCICVICGIIPIINMFTWIAVLVLLIIFFNQAIDGINSLVEIEVQNIPRDSNIQPPTTKEEDKDSTS